MDSTNQQISKKMFRTYFSIFLSLGVFSLVYSGYALYLGLISGEANGLVFIGLLFYLFIIFIAFIVFLVLIINNAKNNRKETFLTISKIAIVGEIFVIICASGLVLISRSQISRQKASHQEYLLAENATSYKDCVNMRSWIDKCASTVNEKTGNLQGCINLSIDYAKKGENCFSGERRNKSPKCLVGFGCLEKNTYKVVLGSGSSYYKNTVWFGNADGTVTCKKEDDLYCPLTDNIEETQMQKLQKFLKLIFAGKTREVKSDFEPVMMSGHLYFSKNFVESENQGISIKMEVYPYEKEDKYRGKQAGDDWYANLDDKVNNYLTLKLGIPEMRQFDNMFGPVQTTLSKFGNKNWAVYETASKPISAINRSYYNYDEENHQLIFLSIIITDTEKMNISNDYSADNKLIDMKIGYPDDIKNIINQVEQILGEF